jgi:membrane-bound lytic murein transglycosylase D
MSRIYGVIKLVDPDRHGGRKINKRRIKKAKKLYRGILRKLMRGEVPSGPVEQLVAGFFGPGTKPSDFRSALRNIRCQIGQKDRFRAGIIRSGAYMDEIKQIFRDNGLPEDLAYLPHVESSFNPKAYSKFGAAGIWQFTRSTGKHFMKIGYSIDERRDPILSSYAAAKLLRQNHQKLKSWPMAISAYNHGVSGMLRAKRSRGSYEAIFKSYRSRIFKFASRNFYSEFLAAREAASNYRQYFGDLNLDTPINSRELLLAGYVSLPEVARHLELDLADLRELNPALRHPVFRGQKYVPRGYRLRLPGGSNEVWEALIEHLPQTLYRNYQKRSQIYTVRRGDTAGKIARNHGVKLNDLIAANNLDTRATIYVDQDLKIPQEDGKAARIAKRNSRESEKKKSAPVLRSPMLKKDAGTQAPPAPGRLQANRSEHSADYAHQTSRVPVADDKAVWVAESEQLLSAEDESGPGPFTAVAGMTSHYVADQAVGESPQIQAAEKMAEKKTFSMPASLNSREIKTETTSEYQANKLPQVKQAPDNPQPMDFWQFKRNVPAPNVNPEIFQGHLAVKNILPQGGKPVGTIRVEVEETLGHYAEWLGVPATKIRQLNGLSYGRALHLNQRIKVPLHRVNKEEFEEKRFEYHQGLAEDFFASYRVEKVLTYSIKRGDNIWTLSRQEFEVPLWLIKRYNADVDLYTLIPSQKLLIPVVEKNV